MQSKELFHVIDAARETPPASELDVNRWVMRRASLCDSPSDISLFRSVHRIVRGTRGSNKVA